MNGAELWAKRIALGLTPARLSEKIGVNKRNITRMEQREDNVSSRVADAVNDLYDRRNKLVRIVWEQSVGEDGSVATLNLIDSYDVLPDYAPEGTTRTEWNNAVVAVFNEASETTRPRVEWNRYSEAFDRIDENVG